MKPNNRPIKTHKTLKTYQTNLIYQSKAQNSRLLIRIFFSKGKFWSPVRRLSADDTKINNFISFLELSQDHQISKYGWLQGNLNLSHRIKHLTASAEKGGAVIYQVEIPIVNLVSILMYIEHIHFGHFGQCQEWMQIMRTLCCIYTKST